MKNVQLDLVRPSLGAPYPKTENLTVLTNLTNSEGCMGNNKSLLADLRPLDDAAVALLSSKFRFSKEEILTLHKYVVLLNRLKVSPHALTL
jgi:hypothetical protein